VKKINCVRIYKLIIIRIYDFIYEHVMLAYYSENPSLFVKRIYYALFGQNKDFELLSQRYVLSKGFTKDDIINTFSSIYYYKDAEERAKKRNINLDRTINCYYTFCIFKLKKLVPRFIDSFFDIILD